MTNDNEKVTHNNKFHCQNSTINDSIRLSTREGQSVSQSVSQKF